jgi:hypothetical protein
VATEKQVKADAGFQVEGFAGAHQGYFCGTCRAIDYQGAKAGWCTGLNVPVMSYGCCNFWKLAPDSKVRGADGVRLKVIR